MKYGKHWSIPEKKKEEYIKLLLPQLSTLRAKSGLSQGELSSLVGISRQTYCLTESGARGMSWNTYLALVMFYDCNVQTRDLLHNSGIFPRELLELFNPDDANAGIAPSSNMNLTPKLSEMFDSLDKSGKDLVVTNIIMEYARCKECSKSELLHLLSDLL